MENNSPKNLNSQKGKSQARTFFVWSALILIVMLLKFYADGTSAAQEFSIRDLMREAAADNITELTIRNDPNGGQNWYEVTGYINNPRFGKEGAPANTPRKNPFKFSGTILEDNYKILTSPSAPWEIREKSANSAWSSVFFTILPFLLVIGVIYFLISRQMRLSGKSAMDFGKSRARLLSPDKDRTTFDDVAGCDEAKEEVAEIVDFLKTPEKFRKIGAKIPKGILMMGPPGTGKTLLARAIAGEANVPFYSISGSDFMEMFVGVGAARVRDMFEVARKNAPCLIFIDEIDAVGRQRGAGMGGGHDEREQTLNSLLTEMDGFDGHEGIIIIAATNRPDVLDSALLRPGRFDRQVVIDTPDAKGREEILKIHARKIKLAEDVDLQTVARLCPGCSGADLANLLNESAITAARRNSPIVSMQDINIARDKVFFGRERRRLMDDDEKKLIACHESGHAITQCVLDSGNMPVHKVTIIPRGQSLGSTMFLPKRDVLTETKANLLNQICSTLGGRVAEEIAFGEITNGAASDIKQATKIARKMVCDWGMGTLGPIALGENQEHIFLGKEIARDRHFSEKTAQLIDDEIKNVIDAQLNRARDILNSRRAQLDLMSAALVEFETIDGDLARDIVSEKVKTLDEIKERLAQPKPDETKSAETPSPAATPSINPAPAQA
ncbi:MAG: ATP-dependent zinc metalloprotease FtsH [Opitutales bacterium]|nr:ATP-dependent zinc metalloprotease FtsH [Opitutales bacterium]